MNDLPPASPSPSLEDGREVHREENAPDFASAVAAAIAELERSGGKVLKVERT